VAVREPWEPAHRRAHERIGAVRPGVWHAHARGRHVRLRRHGRIHAHARAHARARARARTRARARARWRRRRGRPDAAVAELRQARLRRVRRDTGRRRRKRQRPRLLAGRHAGRRLRGASRLLGARSFANASPPDLWDSSACGWVAVCDRPPTERLLAALALPQARARPQSWLHSAARIPHRASRAGQARGARVAPARRGSARGGGRARLGRGRGRALARAQVGAGRGRQAGRQLAGRKVGHGRHVGRRVQRVAGLHVSVRLRARRRPVRAVRRLLRPRGAPRLWRPARPPTRWRAGHRSIHCIAALRTKAPRVFTWLDLCLRLGGQARRRRRAPPRRPGARLHAAEEDDVVAQPLRLADQLVQHAEDHLLLGRERDRRLCRAAHPPVWAVAHPPVWATAHPPVWALAGNLCAPVARNGKEGLSPSF